MTFPAFVFGFLIGALCGAAFHFWRAESVKKLILYLILGEIGFWIGHTVGNKLQWEFGMIGMLNSGMGIIGALLVLFVGSWLSRVEIKQ